MAFFPFRNILLMAVLVVGLCTVSACKSGTGPEKRPEPEGKPLVFAKGADVSWLTEMEAHNKRFYNALGVQTDCMQLLKDLGMNAIRLRVWVNPKDGWCNAADVVNKARRAAALGMRVMVDFHYSDGWADPDKQYKPAAWATLDFSGLTKAVAQHTEAVLIALKNAGITPEWVQVGNETTDGMLWEDGRASKQMDQYAALHRAGYEAAKKIFPEVRVLVHIDNGYDNARYRRIFDGLKKAGAQWDIIGMSLYPEPSDWTVRNTQLIGNINDMYLRYGTPSMVVEVGMSWDRAADAENWLTDLITRLQSLPDARCRGVFYWEPECYGGWKHYTKGAFDDQGRPTRALAAFAL